MLAGGPQSSARQLEQPQQLGPRPQSMIPRLIHQTYKSGNVPSAVVPYMQSWRERNSEWEVRFYNDAECLHFVQSEFPEYVAAYQALPKDVERSDFFRQGSTFHT